MNEGLPWALRIVTFHDLALCLHGDRNPAAVLKALHNESGWLSPESGGRCDTKGVHLTRPLDASVTWRELGVAVETAFTAEHRETVADLSRAHADLVMTTGPYDEWRTKPAQAETREVFLTAEADLYRRQRAAAARVRSAALAALAAPSGQLELFEAS